LAEGSTSSGGANVPSCEGALQQPGKYNGTLSLHRRCGRLSNYFDQLFSFLLPYTGEMELVTRYRPGASLVDRRLRSTFATIRRATSSGTAVDKHHLSSVNNASLASTVNYAESVFARSRVWLGRKRKERRVSQTEV